MISFLLAGLGLLILLLAGDALVRGAVNISLRLGVPALIVSLTIYMGISFCSRPPALPENVEAVMDV